MRAHLHAIQWQTQLDAMGDLWWGSGPWASSGNQLLNTAQNLLYTTAAPGNHRQPPTSTSGKNSGGYSSSA